MSTAIDGCVPPCVHPPTEIAHCAGRLAVAHVRSPTVDGVCSVCGEAEGPDGPMEEP